MGKEHMSMVLEAAESRLGGEFRTPDEIDAYRRLAGATQAIYNRLMMDGHFDGAALKDRRAARAVAIERALHDAGLTYSIGSFEVESDARAVLEGWFATWEWERTLDLDAFED